LACPHARRRRRHHLHWPCRSAAQPAQTRPPLQSQPFERAYKFPANLAANLTAIPIVIEAADPYNSYFKFNLDHINFYNLLASGDSWWARIGYQTGFRTLRNPTWAHQNAFFGVIESAIDGKDETRDQHIRDNLDAWLQRQRHDFWVDLRPTRPACDDDDNRGCDIVSVSQRSPADFLCQRSPCQLYRGLYGTVEGAGIDYILPYWMALGNTGSWVRTPWNGSPLGPLV